MSPLGGNARAGENDINRNAPMGWAYLSETDALADIQTAGYFDTFNVYLTAGQFIYVFLTDGKFIVTIASVDRALQQVTLDGAVIAPGTEPIIIGVSNTALPVTVTIPTIQILAGLRFIIKDESGGAGTNNITVETEGSETIDGEASASIVENFGTLELYSDETNLFSRSDFNTNLTTRIPARQPIGLIEIFNLDDLIKNATSFIAGVLRLGGNFKINAIIDIGSNQIVLDDNSRFLGNSTNISEIIGNTTGVLIDTGGFRLVGQNVTFQQQGSGPLLKINTTQLGSSSVFTESTLQGGLINLEAGFAFTAKGVRFATGTRLIQKDGGGVSIIDIDAQCQFTDSGLIDGLIVIEANSQPLSMVLKNVSFAYQTSNSIGISILAGAIVDFLEMDTVANTSIVATGNFLIKVENPDDVSFGNLSNISKIELFGGSNDLLICDPVSAETFNTPNADPQGITQDGDGNIIISDSTANPGKLTRMVGISATTDTEIDSPGNDPGALAWFRGDLYSLDTGTNTIYQHDGFSTTILSSFAGPSGDTTGIAFVGENLITIDSTTHLITIHDGFSTTELKNFASPSNTARLSVANDGVNLLVGNGAGVIFVQEGFSFNEQYNFQSAALTLRDIWVIFDAANDSVGFAVCDANSDEFHIYNHPVTFDHSSRTWELEDISGVTSSADRGGSEFSGSPITIPLTTFGQWEDIAATGVFYNAFEQNEKVRLDDETTGKVMFLGVREEACAIAGLTTFTRAGNAADRFYQIAIELEGEIIKDTIAEFVLPDASTFATTTTIPIARKLIDGASAKVKIRQIQEAAETIQSPQVKFAKLSIT